VEGVTTMKFCHHIKLSVFVKIDEGEDEAKIRAGLLSLIPFDLVKEKVPLNIQTAKGFEDHKIRIYEIDLTKDRHIKEFLVSFISHLTEDQKQLLLRQVESRLDEENNFFIRLDKNKLQLGVRYIVDHGNCYHTKMSIAAFPTNRENAKTTVGEILKLEKDK